MEPPDGSDNCCARPRADDRPDCRSDDDEEEEDWSQLAADPLSGGFARFERRTVRLDDENAGGASGSGGPPRLLDLACAPALSPLDMLDLGDGTHDATGHVVWMGALLFLEALRRPGAWTGPAAPTLEAVFAGKRTLELGCGTGIAGLAALVSFGASGGVAGSSAAVTSVVLTDFDEGVLDLCRRNCERNLDVEQQRRCSVRKLSWGRSLDNAEAQKEGEVLQGCRGSIKSCSFDTVIATDVLYDISSLTPLLTTASKKLRSKGYMILSHVPRATLRDDRAVSSSEELEEYITKEAVSFRLRRVLAVRPDDILRLGSAIDPSYPLNGVSLEDMKDAGAAILVFQKVAAIIDEDKV